MKTEQKAKELVDKFEFSFAGMISNEEDWETLAKQCALIAVDEILEAITFNMYDEEYYNKEDYYWQQVKIEIQKL
jgi:hypothetical protein